MKEIDRLAIPWYLRPFAPNFWAREVADIDFDWLAKEHNVKAVAFDIDSTLVYYRQVDVGPKTLANIKNAVENGTIKHVAIATNRRSFNFADLIDQLGGSRVVFVHANNFFDSKPWGAYYRRLYKKLEAKPKHTLMVGDKIFTDIYGGNRHDMQTLHVDRLGPDSWLDKLLPFRYIERYIAHHYSKRIIK